MTHDPTPLHAGRPVRVWLTISSFRHDGAVLEMLRKAKDLVPSIFERVLVIDSLGTGSIPRVIDEERWNFVDYESASTNLGSAGNLARRLERAAEAGADYAYALNHDGDFNAESIRELIATAKREPELAVLYPLRRLVNRGGKVDVTGRLRWPVPRLAVATAPESPTFPVYWGSSNGTLYALEPVRQGLCPWADLWMGFEDLGYGWLLTQRGYRQAVVCGAEFKDGYEFQPVFGGLAHRSDKAAWYTYYFARNLILVARRTEQPISVVAGVAMRIAMEGLVSATLRPHRRQRLLLLLRGLTDGFSGRSGQLPSSETGP